MSNATPARLVVCCAAACLIAGGCGQAGSSRDQAAARAPRVLKLPAQIKPLAAPDLDTGADFESRSVPAQYQQPQAPAPSSSAKIVEVASPADAAAGAIREPTPSPQLISEPTSAPPPRGQFVPITMPEPSTTARSATLPELPAQPTFTARNNPPAPAPPPRTQVWQAPAITPPSAPPVAVDVQPMVAAASSADKPFVPTPEDAAAMQVVCERAMQMADQAAAMAQRGMLYAARTELIHALQLIAQAVDVQQATATHSAALAAGLTALEEARDFSAQAAHPGEAIDVAAVAATHRTPLLQRTAGTPLSPVVAQQQYLAQAHTHLATAAGGTIAGSQILYRLGRLQTAMAAHDADPLALHGPQSIVFHQAALDTDGANWLAANELGVLFARYGQLGDARRLLLHSVTIHPHVEGWQNLAVVHRRLGESDLAQRAEQEGRMVAQRTGQSTTSSEMVHWVDPRAFAATGGQDVHWPATEADKAVAASPSAPRR